MLPYFNKLKHVNKLTISDLLQNSWSTNGQNSIFKMNNIVFVNLALRNGTDKNVLVLPDGYKPSANLMQQLVGSNGKVGYILVTVAGQVSFERLTISEIGSETFMTSFSFPVI